MASFSKSRGKSGEQIKKKEERLDFEVDYMFELDKDIIFTDKADYKLAVGYQNAIFQNGITVIDPEEKLSRSSQAKVILDRSKFKDTEHTVNQTVHPVNQSNTDVTGNSSSDDEENIDQNPVVEQYKEEMNGKVRSPMCNASKPLVNIVSIKTHRTGSSTLANILYRFGEQRNLTFILPSASTYQYFWPLRFHISHAAVNLLNKEQPNMLVNAGRFARTHIKPMMHNDTMIISILRDPVDHFESVYEYADISKLIGLSNSTLDPFETFLEAPKNNVIKFVQNSRSFAMELNLLKNGMAFDLGLDHQSFSDEDAISEFIKKLEKQIDFVAMAEYFDESLVLIKRMLCWETEDIIYIKHRVRNPAFKNKVTEKQKEKIRKWNLADVMLYDHFNQTFWEKIKQQGEDFHAEVTSFKFKVAQITEICFERVHNVKAFELPITQKNNIPKELKDVCQKLRLSEKEYIRLLKDKQKERIRQSNLKAFSKIFYKEKNNTRVFYAKDNATAANMTNIYD
eukprot:gene7153-12809_t